MVDDEALLKELLDTFRDEARDHLDALSGLLAALRQEKGAEERLGILEVIFRRLHTLKGAAHAVNLAEISGRCQVLESLLADLKRGDLPLDPAALDRLQADVDRLSELILLAREGGGGKRASGAPSPGPESAEGRRPHLG